MEPVAFPLIAPSYCFWWVVQIFLCLLLLRPCARRLVLCGRSMSGNGCVEIAAILE
jgi:hypothetical protein